MIEGLSSQFERIGKEAAKSKEPRRLANADRDLLGELQSEIQPLHEEIRALKQMLEEMKSNFDRAVSKLSPPATEEQQKQTEEPEVG